MHRDLQPVVRASGIPPRRAIVAGPFPMEDRLSQQARV
jgi:hypothetical protein